MKLIAKVELLLIGMWLGAACFFSFGVAPSAFAVLPTAEMAGNIVNRTLAFINISGFVIGLVTLASSFLPRTYKNAAVAWIRRILLVILTGACGAGYFVISFWLAFLRLQIGKPVNELAADDPLKLRFDQLHQASVWVLAAGMVAALLVFFVTSRGVPKSGEKPAGEPEFDFTNDLKI